MTHPKPFELPELTLTDERYEDFSPARERASKYAEFFATIAPNKRIRCPAGEKSVQNIASNLRRWLKAQGHTRDRVRQRADCKYGHGGVWWIQAEPKPQTTLANSPWPASHKPTAKAAKPAKKTKKQ